MRRRSRLIEEVLLFTNSIEATVRQCRTLPGPPGPPGPDGRPTPGQPVTLGASTIRRYCTKIEKRWAKEDAEKRPKEKERLARLVRSLIRKALGEGAFGAAMRGTEMLARLHGLFAPSVLEVRKPGEQPNPFAGWKLRDIDEYQRLKAQLGKAAGANGAGNGAGGNGVQN